MHFRKTIKTSRFILIKEINAVELCSWVTNIKVVMLLYNFWICSKLENISIVWDLKQKKIQNLKKIQS